MVEWSWALLCQRKFTKPSKRSQVRLPPALAWAIFKTVQDQTRSSNELMTDDSRITSGVNFPDPEQRPFPSSDSVLQGVQRRKRQNANGQVVKRQIGGGQNFPNFFQLSGSDQSIPQPLFPNTQGQIGGSSNFETEGPNFGPGNFPAPTFGGFDQQQRRKRNQKHLFEVNYDVIDSLSAPGQPSSFRPNRNAQNNQQGGPR